MSDQPSSGAASGHRAAPQTTLAVPLSSGTAEFDAASAAYGLTRQLFWAFLGFLIGVFVLVLVPAWQPGPAGRIGEAALRNWSDRVRLPHLEQLDVLIEDLGRLADSRDLVLRDPQAAARTILVLEAIAPLDPRRRRVLDQCMPAAQVAANDPTRQGRIEACLVVIDGLKREATTLPDADSMKLLVDLVRAQEDAAQAHRGFVLQLAQAGLINVFLPLLTALLGYMFATRGKLPGGE